MASKTLSRDEIVKGLKANRSAGEKILPERDKLMLAAREADPKITVREIAELCGLTEVAVNKRLKQIREGSV